MILNDTHDHDQPKNNYLYRAGKIIALFCSSRVHLNKKINILVLKCVRRLLISGETQLLSCDRFDHKPTNRHKCFLDFSQPELKNNVHLFEVLLICYLHKYLWRDYITWGTGKALQPSGAQ
jgi:hypothetical protein